MTEAVAETDSEGQTLVTACRYRVTSTGPLPRWWSIATVGRMSEPASLQHTADADSLVREADGTAIIVISATPWPGNWLKAPEQRGFSLLYSATGGASQTGAAAPPFAITREGC